MQILAMRLAKGRKFLEKDAKGKYYLADNRRIVDLVNGYCFGGERKIHPDEVREENTGLFYLPETLQGSVSEQVKREKAGKQKKVIQREHDMIFRVIRGTNCVILGVEAQTYLDPAMVLRVLDYTVGQYMKQRHEIVKRHREKKDLEKAEYLSGFSLQDLLKPVIILVIYFGDDEWRGAKSLHELLDWSGVPEEWKKMFADYEMQILEVQKLKDLSVFHTDLKLLFGFLQSKNDKEKLKAFVKENREELSDIQEDLFLFMGALGDISQINSMQENSGITAERRKKNMCKAIDDMVEDGRIEGELRGTDRVNKLVQYLLAENRLDDLKRAAEDREYQNQLFTAYAL